jgi:hypothetical protein
LGPQRGADMPLNNHSDDQNPGSQPHATRYPLLEALLAELGLVLMGFVSWRKGIMFRFPGRVCAAIGTTSMLTDKRQPCLRPSG